MTYRCPFLRASLLLLGAYLGAGVLLVYLVKG